MVPPRNGVPNPRGEGIDRSGLTVVGGNGVMAGLFFVPGLFGECF